MGDGAAVEVGVGGAVGAGPAVGTSAAVGIGPVVGVGAAVGVGPAVGASIAVGVGSGVGVATTERAGPPSPTGNVAVGSLKQAMVTRARRITKLRLGFITLLSVAVAPGNWQSFSLRHSPMPRRDPVLGRDRS